MKRKLFFTIISICIGISFLLIAILLIRRSANFVSQPSVEVAQIYQPVPTPGSDLQALEMNAGIKIPANAREIYGMVTGFRDLNTYVRFDLPETDMLPYSGVTNMVFLRIRKGNTKDLTGFLKNQGILITDRNPLRLVTHLDVDRNAVDSLIKGFKQYFSSC